MSKLPASPARTNPGLRNGILFGIRPVVIPKND